MTMESGGALSGPQIVLGFLVTVVCLLPKSSGALLGATVGVIAGGLPGALMGGAMGAVAGWAFDHYVMLGHSLPLVRPR